MPRPSKLEAAGRVCAAPGCETGLSIYNAKSTCWQHTDLTFPNFRGKRLAKGSA
ncbi:MAG TPA: hypothetical protein VF097_02295 [Actinomycetota bacterium]